MKQRIRRAESFSKPAAIFNPCNSIPLLLTPRFRELLEYPVIQSESYNIQLSRPLKMSDHIVHILPEQVASQIAAGEVVERPASAVKELVENSLDAGARSVSVEILGGGSALIAVADDGSGMTRADAILSLRRHATSKIRSAADLTAIRTLGFRGEALASIASVSHLRMQTRRAADDNGVEVAAEAGNIEDTRTCAIAAGTRIEVRQFFSTLRRG